MFQALVNLDAAERIVKQPAHGKQGYHFSHLLNQLKTMIETEHDSQKRALNLCAERKAVL
jgi:hypothetical protein